MASPSSPSCSSSWPKITSSYHQGTYCGPCYICGKDQERYDHFNGLPNDVQQFLNKHMCSPIPGNSCLCRSHCREAKRHGLDPEYIPIWKEKENEVHVSKCIYPECVATSAGQKIITSEEYLLLTESLNIPTGVDITLCEKHYQYLYRKLHTLEACAGCGVKPKVRQNPFFRHSPDADTVCQYLNEHTEFSLSLKQEDTICKSCYDLHKVILQNMEKELAAPQSLQSDIMLWSMTIQDDSITEVTRAVLATVLYIAKLLLDNRALLLPHAAKIFRKNYPFAEEDSDLYLEVRDGTIMFTNKWLMNQLIIYLHPYMGYKCVVPRIGTLLYLRNGDLLKSLSHALYKSPYSDASLKPNHSQTEEVDQNSVAVLHEAGAIVNDLLLQEVRKCKDRANLDLTTFNLDNSIQEVSRLLWEFICLCTRSYRERTSRPHSDNVHTKRVRNYYIICMMMFATNSSCDTVLHHLIADTVEVCGGSRNLVKTLNRLGVCVSNDTHDRFVTCVADKQHKASVWDELSPEVFTVATVDNIDFLQRHAAVYHGALSRSYHGTTIQIVQPIPSFTCSVRQAVASGSIPACSTQTTLSSTFNSVTVSSKRQASSSPANSPHKLGKFGPKRPRTVEVVRKRLFNSSNTHQLLVDEDRHSLKLENFLENEDETASRKHVSAQVFAYLIQKSILNSSTEHEGILKPLRQFLLPTPAQLANHDKSEIYYMELLDENADSEQTMAEVAEMVLSKVADTQKWIILVGDGKTFEHLCKVKRLYYGSALSNVLIFPGDWHILKNYQPVLMKVWYHLGLKDIAKANGYRAETLTSLESCSHFVRTHTFLIQVWEALYLEIIRAFLNAKPQLNDIKAKLQTILTHHSDGSSPIDLINEVQELVSEKAIHSEFNSFVETQAANDDTWKLWTNFVFHDCYCYINLFLAIRTSNWELRMSSLKSMAALFSAYDRPCYQRLLPKHMADLQRYPDEVIHCLQAGGFTVKLRGEVGHAVALDECHEMCINRDLKMAVVRPSTAYLKKTTFFFSYRIKAQKQFTSQLFPSPTLPTSMTIWDTTSCTRRWEENVTQMRLLIAEHCIFTLEIGSNRGVVNLFTNVQATAEQAHDLLSARDIGKQGYINFVTHYLMQLPSVNAPVRKKQLLTMAPLKMTKRRMSQKQREQRDTLKCLRKRLTWCNETGQRYNESEEQYTVLPRSLANVDGTPQRGTKSNWTQKLQNRYQGANSPFVSALDWVPQITIIDSMFIINITPLRQHLTLEHYTDLLFRQYCLPHYVHGTSEVHLVFDSPSNTDFNPKSCEQSRRDSQASVSKNHRHFDFTPDSPIPRPWREYLECRKCKRSLIEALAIAFCKRAVQKLRNRQVLVLTGCMPGNTEDYGWELTAGELVPKVTKQFTCTSQEADMRVWRHALQTQYHNILIYSPDTDVFNIGLTLLRPGCNYITQINLPQNSPRYININKLLRAFETDPDLACVQRDKLGSIIQQLYICTGCDYVSYVAGIGKAMFINCFFQHADFISGTSAEGDLSMTNDTNVHVGFLSLIRLFGTVYFKKHLATVISRLEFDTPTQLFNSIPCEGNTPDSESKHKQWYMLIRGAIPVMSEDQRPPTITSLWRHWLRSSWVNRMWANSPKADLYRDLAPPDSRGWIKDEATSEWKIDWEAEEVQQKIRRTIDFLRKGCSCKTGCRTNRCGCRKTGKFCGAGCECRGCVNTHLEGIEELEEEEDGIQEREQEDDDDAENEEEVEEESELSEEEECIETEIVNDIFDDPYIL